MSSSSLENEDLENVPLVRMEDVQPPRERVSETQSPSHDVTEVYETCLIDNIDYVNEYVIHGDENDDDDSNIGSMVSLQSEDVYEDGDSNQELIIPENLDEMELKNPEEPIFKVYVRNERNHVVSEDYLEDPIEDDRSYSEDKLNDVNLKVATGKYMNLMIDPELDEGNLNINSEDNTESIIKGNKYPKISNDMVSVEDPPKKKKKSDEVGATPPSDKWPTLEILPGGVIKNTDKYDNDNLLCSDQIPETIRNTEEMMYACAKCSQTFKYLFCLVKHVKWHEDQKKVKEYPNLEKMSATEQELINLKRERLELDKLYKQQKLHALFRIAAAIEKLKNVPSLNIFLRGPPSDEYVCLHSSKNNIAVTEKSKRRTPKRLKSKS